MHLEKRHVKALQYLLLQIVFLQTCLLFHIQTLQHYFLLWNSTHYITIPKGGEVGSRPR